MDIVIGEQVKKVVKLATIIIGVLAIGASAWGAWKLMRPCTYCHGQPVICPLCSGTKDGETYSSRCLKCNGTGKKWRFWECPNCKGRGSIKIQMSCTRCDGKGVVRCPKCNK